MTALEDLLSAAAEARAAGARENAGGNEARALASRPSQRRAEEGARTLPVVGCRARITLERTAEFRTGSDGAPTVTGLAFDGFASVYDRGYEMWDFFGPYTEQVVSGAGSNSLSRQDLDVPFVLAHDSMRRMARTTNGSLLLSEESVDDWDGAPATGLRVRAPGLDPNDPDVAYIAPKLDAGLIDEMSFKFRITAGEWSPDWMEYHIDEYDIHRGDVAVVGYGANPHTHGSGLRSDLQSMSDKQLRKVLDELHAEHVRRGLAPAVFVPAVQLAPAPSTPERANSLGISRASLLLDD